MKKYLLIIVSCVLLLSCGEEATGSSSAGGDNDRAVQCSAYTKEGKRCTRTTTNASGRCWQHE